MFPFTDTPPAPIKRMRDQRGWLLRDASMGALGAHTAASVFTPAMIAVNCVNEMHARLAQKRQDAIAGLV